jgi:hypothetical protein
MSERQNNMSTKCKALFMIVILLVPSISAIGAQVTAKQKPIPVEVWCGGDDGLTLRLRDAVEHAFATSPDFQLSSGKRAGTLIVTIPTNVGWKRTGKKTRVLYHISLSTVDGKLLGKWHGSCLDDALQNCAASIVRHSRRVIHSGNESR